MFYIFTKFFDYYFYATYANLKVFFRNNNILLDFTEIISLLRRPYQPRNFRLQVKFAFGNRKISLFNCLSNVQLSQKNIAFSFFLC